MATTSLGIFQSDIILRTALLIAIKDIRDNPWLLDYAFVGLLQDTLTTDDYGQKQVMEAKRWFMAADLPVFNNLMTEPPKIPSITISLLGGAESEVTLGDKHYDPEEDLDSDPPVIGPFIPKSFDFATGTMVLPDVVSESTIVVPGMAIIGTDGHTRYAISEVEDAATIILSPNIKADFSKCTLHYRLPVARIQLESVEEKEDYLIGVHCDEPAKTIILASIVKFILYRYKQSLLEGRGLEKTVFTTADLTKLQNIAPEFAYSRYFTLTGYVRQFWPKNIVQTFQSVDTKIAIEGSGTSPSDIDPNEQLWVGDEDVLSGLGSSGSGGT